MDRNEVQTKGEAFGLVIALKGHTVISADDVVWIKNAKSYILVLDFQKTCTNTVQNCPLKETRSVH